MKERITLTSGVEQKKTVYLKAGSSITYEARPEVDGECFLQPQRDPDIEVSAVRVGGSDRSPAHPFRAEVYQSIQVTLRNKSQSRIIAAYPVLVCTSKSVSEKGKDFIVPFATEVRDSVSHVLTIHPGGECRVFGSPQKRFHLERLLITSDAKQFDDLLVKQLLCANVNLIVGGEAVPGGVFDEATSPKLNSFFVEPSNRIHALIYNTSPVPLRVVVEVEGEYLDPTVT